MRTLVIFAITTTAFASTARAASPAADADVAAPRAFGRGAVVLTLGNMQWLNQPTSPNSGLLGSTQLTGSLAVDLVLPNDWTAGLGTTLGWHHWDQSAAGAATSSTSWALSARLGRVIPLSSFATWWPVASLGVARGQTFLLAQSQTSLLASLDLPLVVHPGRHLFVGAGPTITASTNDAADFVSLYGHIIFGGTFGG